jgi:hypothetical protein
MAYSDTCRCVTKRHSRSTACYNAGLRTLHSFSRSCCRVVGDRELQWLGVKAVPPTHFEEIEGCLALLYDPVH